MTSRDEAGAKKLFLSTDSIIRLGPMDQSASLELHQSRVSIPKSSKRSATRLVQLLEGVPLAITHAASYMAQVSSLTINEYLQLYEASEESQTSLLENEVGSDLRRDFGSKNSIIATWRVTFDYILNTHPSTAELLSLMSVLDGENIQKQVLIEDGDSIRFEKRLTPLLNFSLVTESDKGDSWQMHRLVQVATRRWLEVRGELKEWKCEAIERMAKIFPSGDHETIKLCKALLPHVLMTMEYTPRETGAILLTSMLHRMTTYLYRTGDFSLAETTSRVSLDRKTKMLGETHSETLESQAALVLILRAQGKLSEAWKMNVQLLQLTQEHIGPFKSLTVQVMDSLAMIRLSQNKLEDAEKLEKDVIYTSENTWGPYHAETLNFHGRLAVIYMYQKKIDEARVLLDSIRRIQQKLSTKDTKKDTKKDTTKDVRWTIWMTYYLAYCVFRQGDVKEALVLLTEARDQSEQKFGHDFHDTICLDQSLAEWRSLRKQASRRNLFKTPAY